MNELTESQKQWIMLNSEDNTITSLGEKFNVAYYTIYNFCTKHNLKVSLNENRLPQRQKQKRDEKFHVGFMKESAAVVPDPPRKWQRVNDGYSNMSREQYIDKILNDD